MSTRQLRGHVTAFARIRRAVPPVGAILSLAALVSGSVACREASSPRPAVELRAAKVRVQGIAAKRRQAFEEVVGTVRAKVRATVEAKVGGRITRLDAALGQAVKLGQVLARIDAQEIRARVDQANAVLQQAESDHARYAALLKEKAVPPREYDAVQARLQVARAAAAEARTMMGYTVVTAPFSGVVTSRLAEMGDLAGPGRPLVAIEDPRVLSLEIDVPETLISRIKVGSAMAVRLDSTPEPLAGRVSELAPAASPGSRTYLVKVELPRQANLRTGQFGRAAVPTEETTILRAPASAVVQRGQMEIVFTVDGDRVFLRLVKTGRPLGSEVELVSGVSDGDIVVFEGADGLTDGQRVEVQP